MQREPSFELLDCRRRGCEPWSEGDADLFLARRASPKKKVSVTVTDADENTVTASMLVSISTYRTTGDKSDDQPPLHHIETP